MRPKTTTMVWILACALLASPLGAEPEKQPAPTLHVLGARIRVLKPDGKAWDGDHKKIPGFVYGVVSGMVGFPPASILGAVPYRNRPDPYLVVRAGEKEIARSKTFQGTFLPPFLLRVDLAEASAPTTSFEVMDDDLAKDDRIGRAVVSTAELLQTPGLRVLEGSGGLADVRVVVRVPGAGEGEEARLEIQRIEVKSRKRRPTGGDWDAGGLPLKGRLPKRLPLPDKLEGLEMVRPDLIVEAAWTGGGTRTSEPGKDDWEMDWSDVGLEVSGRRGRGDGLVLRVRDDDPALDDPVGVMWISFEDLWKARKKGTLVRKADELSGLERVEIRFRVVP